MNHKVLLFFFLIIGLLNFSPGRAQAGTALFVAIPDGSNPGIYRIDDINGDGDALDSNENQLYASGADFIDVAADTNGVLYAIKRKNGNVFRLADGNNDGDALDSGEATLFRSQTPTGLTLKGPLSIAVDTAYDPFLGQERALVYVHDLTALLTYRLEDRNGDNQASNPNEIFVIHESKGGTPFTANRMALDELGRVLGVDSNIGTITRIEDRNGDGNVVLQKTSNEKCRPATCGRSDFDEFTFVRKFNSSDQINLIRPFGITFLSSDQFFVTDAGGRGARIIKLTDSNNNDQNLDIGEASIFFTATTSESFYDIVLRGNEFFVGAQNNSTHAITLEKFVDLNSDGTIQATSERSTFAQFGGLPLGICTVPAKKPPLHLSAAVGFETSPTKGPLLVLEPSQTATFTLFVSDLNGNPAPNVKIGSQVMHGCLSLCPVSGNHWTDANGMISYKVKRIYEPGEDDELLKFWTYGHELRIPIIKKPCTPPPVANPGPNLKVAIGASATLDGSASSGSGIEYCWTQTAGPSVGLPECQAGDGPNQTITAPNSDTVLAFLLSVRNQCDVIVEKMLIVEVGNAVASDGDGDGVFDIFDNCPEIANADQQDGDLDGIGDLCDNCPQAANTDQKDGDGDGVGLACDRSDHCGAISVVITSSSRHFGLLLILLVGIYGAIRLNHDRTGASR